MSEHNEPVGLPDWSREAHQLFWDPPRKLLRALRRYQKLRRKPAPLRWFTPYYTLVHRFWSIVSGADIPLNSQIDGGLMMPHPNGIVVHPDAQIGPNCLLFQQVTVGTGGPKPGTPILRGHVTVGAGARLLGGIVIGEHARIGANAVVLCDVPPGATAVGIPARIVGGSRTSQPERVPVADSPAALTAE